MMNMTRGHYNLISTLSKTVITSAEREDDCVVEVFNVLDSALSLFLSSANWKYRRFKSACSQATQADRRQFLRQEMQIMLSFMDSSKEKKRCIALTKKRTQCKNSCIGSLCSLHHRMLGTEERLETVHNSAHLLVQSQPLKTCRGVTKKGLRCKKVTKALCCHLHKDAEADPAKLCFSMDKMMELIGRYDSRSSEDQPLSAKQHALVDLDSPHKHELAKIIEQEQESMRELYNSRLNLLSTYLNKVNGLDLDDFDQQTESMASYVHKDASAKIEALHAN